MWIDKAHYTTLSGLIDRSQNRSTEMLRRETVALTELQLLRTENERLKAERGWFMHRLTQVEMERAMLMQDRLGVKISVPQFVPATDDPGEALNKLVDLSTVGLDAHDSGEQPGAEYTNLPGYAKR